MGMIETVTGSVSPRDLGFVLMHEHLYLGDWNHKSYVNYAPDSLSYLIRKVIPELMERGVTKEEIKTIFIDNPRRIFAGGL